MAERRDSSADLEELKRETARAVKAVNAKPPPLPGGKKLVLGVQVPPPRPATPLARAVQDAFGKPPPLRSSPHHEPTIRTTVAPPAPGSVAPAKRSISPPPVELAPDPQSVRAARQHARERAAESEREPEKSTLESLAEIPGIRRGVSAVWRWILPFVLAAVATVGGWIYGYGKGLADAYERVAAGERRDKKFGERIASLEGGLEELANAHAAEARSNRAERATAKQRHEELVEKLEKAVPKIQGLPAK